MTPVFKLIMLLFAMMVYVLFLAPLLIVQIATYEARAMSVAIGCILIYALWQVIKPDDDDFPIDGPGGAV